MRVSKIGWCDFSGGALNVVTGCTPVSEGCAHCYARRIYNRFGLDFSNVVTHPDRLRRLQTMQFPTHSPKRGAPYRPMAFVVDTGDLFHPDVPGDFVHEVLWVLANRTDVVWQILTKRPRRMRDVIVSLQPHDWAKQLDHMWFGVSVSNQRTADIRIPVLLDTPVAVRFVSVEPMLGPLNLNWWLPWGDYHSLDWIVVGAESGPDRRPFDTEWAEGVLHDCHDASVPCFLKQGSGLRPGVPLIVDGQEWHEWPEFG